MTSFGDNFWQITADWHSLGFGGYYGMWPLVEHRLNPINRSDSQIGNRFDQAPIMPIFHHGTIFAIMVFMVVKNRVVIQNMFATNLIEAISKIKILALIQG